MSEPSNTAGRGNEDALESDLDLVRAILDGSVSAWHEFIDRYAGLIFGVIRRRLVIEDEDEIRSVYVDILKSLYDGKLNMYRGEARLSTWLTVYTRSRTADFFRQRYGRHSKPKGHDKLTDFDREVLRLYYIDTLPLEAIAHILLSKGFSVKAGAIVESVQRIEELLDRRYLRRLDDAHHAKTWNVDSARMLDYLVRLKMDIEERSGRDRPDVRLMEKEANEIAEQVRAMISRLPPGDRTIIFLRFNLGWTARKIAEKLGLGSQRRAYTRINQVLRKLRERIARGEE